MRDYEVEINYLLAEVKQLRQQMLYCEHWHNTMDTHLHKKLWFWLQGYKWSALGTWYDAPWNHWATVKYNGKFGNGN